MTSYLPLTVDGSEIDPAAPRSQGMSDTEASDLSAFAEEYRTNVLHLHADVAGRDVTLTGANCPEGMVVFSFGDGAAETEQRVDAGATPSVTHTYLTDGVFTAQLIHENRERADLEIAVNWPQAPEAPPEGAP